MVSWSVGLCVTGGSVLEYELRLAETGYYDARSNSSDISTDDKEEKEEDSRIQFKNQNKQGNKQPSLNPLVPTAPQWRVFNFKPRLREF